MKKFKVYELRPSNAHRWMACPGQPAAVDGTPQTSNVHADKGTVAHALLELAFRLDLEEEELERYEGTFLKGTDRDGKPLPQIPVDDTMIRGVGHMLDFTRNYLREHPTARVYPEHEVRWRFEDQSLGGTADLFIDDLPRELVTADYKNGVGVVEEEDNPQLLSYTVAYLKSQKEARPINSKTKFRGVIVQPNARDTRGPVRETVINSDGLHDFYSRMILAIPETRNPDAKRVAGKHCSFCEASGKCRERGELVLHDAKLDFSVVKEIKMLPKDFQPIEVAQIIGAAASLRKWVSDVEALAIASMLRGEKVPGYKLVGSDARKVWKDDAAVVDMLPNVVLEEVAPRKPITPLQLAKKKKVLAMIPSLAKRRLNNLVKQNPIEPRLAPLDDVRKPYVPGSEFK